MTDPLSNIGQNFPSASQSQNPSAKGNSSYKGKDLSFENVLNRQQLTSGQLNSMRPPENFQSSTQTANQNMKNSNAPKDPSSSLFKSYAESGKEYEDEMPEELLKMFQHMPEEVPQGEELNQAILQNQKEYKQFREDMGDQETSTVSIQPKGNLQESDGAASQEMSLSKKPPSDAVEMHAGAPPGQAGNTGVSFGDFASQQSMPPSSSQTQPQTSLKAEERSQPVPSFNSLFASAREGSTSSETGATREYALPQGNQMHPKANGGSRQGFRSSMVPENYQYRGEQQASTNEGMNQVSPEQFASQEARPTWNTNPTQVNMDEEIGTDIHRQEQYEMNQEEGPTESVASFFKNVLSGITFGAYTPSGEQAPKSFTDHVIHPFKKICYEAPKDLVYDYPASMVRFVGEGHPEAGDSKSSEQKSQLAGSSSKPWMTKRFG